MDHIHPYGTQDIRVVSDLSRFDHGRQMPRNRSRNPTPTEQELEAAADVPQRRRNLIEIAELIHGSSMYDDRDDLYNFYAGNPTQPAKPQPKHQHYIDAFAAAPAAPPKDYAGYYGHRNVLLVRHDNMDLPAVQDSRDYAAQQQDLLARRLPQAPAPFIDRVMNRPLLQFGGGDLSNGVFLPEDAPAYVITATNVMDVFQISFAAVILAVASVLSSTDANVLQAEYRLFIAYGAVALVVALLFLLKTVHFHRKLGVFFCLLASTVGAVAMVVAITTLAASVDCATSKICLLRKTLAAFVILLFLFWLGVLVMYFTALYISRMEALNTPEVSPPIYDEKERANDLPHADTPEYVAQHGFSHVTTRGY